MNGHGALSMLLPKPPCDLHFTRTLSCIGSFISSQAVSFVKIRVLIATGQAINARAARALKMELRAVEEVRDGMQVIPSPFLRFL